MDAPRLLIVLLTALLCCAIPATAASPTAMTGMPFPASAPVAHKQLRLALDAPHRALSLDPVTDAERAAAAGAAAIAGKRAPLQVGFGRSVPGTTGQVDLDSLDWQRMADGSRSARIVLESPGATALRAELGFTGSAAGVAFRFGSQAANAAVFGPYTWTDLESMSRWTPVLEGSSAIIDIELEAGVPASGRTLVVSRVAHHIVPTSELASVRAALSVCFNADPGDCIGRSGACNIDVACVANPSADLLAAAASVARMLFVLPSGAPALCTGSLLNSADATGLPTGIPYFVTAHHCIGSQVEAGSINFYWTFEAASCDSRERPDFRMVTGGGTLLYTSYDVDLSLLRMNANPPAGAFLAGWDAGPVFPGLDVIGLHHPHGDLKKYAAGHTVDFAHDFDDVQNPGQFVPQGSYLRINWSLGTTEEGSSGSGVYTRGAGGQYQLRGVLHGGDASCQTPQGLDYFSRFDLAYPALGGYLAGAAPAAAGSNAIEYYNVDLDHYFLTSFESETRSVESGGAGRGWVRTGYSFGVASGSPGAASVCRFYGNPAIDPATGARTGPNSHFYTADPAECAQVKRDPGWVYEGIAFGIGVPQGNTCPAGTVPVFRLYNNGYANNNSNHRYTTSQAVYQFMLTQRWSGEQTVMCAPAPAS